MSRTARIILTVVAAVVVAGIVTGIAFWTANMDTERTDPPGLYLDGSRVEDPDADPLVTVGDTAVPFSYYRYYYLLYKFYYEQQGADFSRDPDGDLAYQLKRLVDSQLQSTYAWLGVAGELGVSLDEEDMATIESDLADLQAQYGDGLDAYLNESRFIENTQVYLDIRRTEALAMKGQNAYKDAVSLTEGQAAADEAEEAFRAANVTIKHILVKVDDEAAADPETLEAAKAGALEEAEALVAQLREVEDDHEALVALFEELQAEHTDDVDAEGNPNSPDGYTFTRDDNYVQVFIDTGFALEEYEVSDPVWNEPPEGTEPGMGYYGWHILLRLPLSESSIETVRSNAETTKVNELMTQKQTELMEQYPVTHGSHYAGLKVDGIR